MSSLPTSDGLARPAHSSGPGPEIGDPPRLACSASASACPVEPSDPGSMEPKAGKALRASAEFQTNSEQKDLLPLQSLPGLASSADQGPAMPLPHASEEVALRGNLEKSAEGSCQGLRLCLRTRQEASVSVTTARMHEPLMLVDKKGCRPENQSLHQLNGLRQHTEPGNKQQEAPGDRGHLRDLGDLRLPEGKQQDQQQIVGLKAFLRGDGLQQNADLPSTEKSFLPPGRFGPSNSETRMELDVVERPVVAVLKAAGSQNASVENTATSRLTPDNPLMEVEASQCGPSPESVNNSVCTQDSQPPESNVEMPGTNPDCGSSLPSLSRCGGCQPSVRATEESRSSVSAALRELHELLVSSSKPAPENTSKVVCQSQTAPEGQTDFPEGWTQSGCPPHSELCPQVSCHQARSASVKTESFGATPRTGTEDTESFGSRRPGDGLSADKEGVPGSRESVSESVSVTITSSESSNHLHCTLGVETSPSLTASEEDALSQTAEHTESLPPGFILVKDLGRGMQNPVTDRPETRENACPDTARPFLELEPPTSRPSSSLSLLSPLIFPATDIDRILRAGFTLQEALGALHRVGGNADLALLVLLAKNIVVPT
ncbi:regulatory solute carrier protein family 1 member 1 [Fukomys damarensis]|uniref:regulatory solute carrier protein family 1 member 1 n=1 Tax=Fukomys damarensis TaxID=885580 RepID=UPI0008FF20AF|nr:regulatory solute carrier protein family 1 member 1 [Fukomys damarensis]